MNRYKDAKLVPLNILCSRLNKLRRVIINKGTPQLYLSIPAQLEHEADIVMCETARRLSKQFDETTKLKAENAKLREEHQTLEKRYALLRGHSTPMWVGKSMEIDLGDIPDNVSITERIDQLVDFALTQEEVK